jgi:hypothetical protein
VGIGVPSDHKKLRIRTSVAPDELDKIIGAWPDELKLKSIKAADTGAGAGGAAPASSENLWLKHGLPVLVAFVTAASTAGVVNLKKAFWPDYKVIITSPAVENGTAKSAGNIVSVSWYLQPEQPSFRAAQKDVIAKVQVYAPSGLQPPVESRPPLPLSLDPGEYVISVDAPGAAPVQFRLLVQQTSSRSSH